MAALTAARAADPASPIVVLPAFAASLSQLNIKITIRYQRKPAGQVVAAVFIRSVKNGSIAEKAGLKKGMEVVAIQYQPVAGLNPFEFDAMCDQAVDDALVLSVKRAPQAAAEEIRIRLKPESAD
jgi:C-terminal processing protease CtpA/Prc